MKKVLFLLSIFLLLISFALAQSDPNDYSFNVGDVKSIWDKAVKLENVGAEGSVIIAVDGIAETISQGEMDYVNGLQVSALKTYYDASNVNQRSAVLTIIGGPEGEYAFDVNDTKVINGKSVSLLAIESDGILVDVDNTREKLSVGVTENVNGLIITFAGNYVGEYEGFRLKISFLTPFNDTSPYNIPSNNIPYNETNITAPEQIPYNETNLTTLEQPHYNETNITPSNYPESTDNETLNYTEQQSEQQSSTRCDGCLDSNTNCVPIGVRVENEFCDINKELKPQLQTNEYCNNNFECDSNVCVANKCIEKGFLEKILAWLMSLFG